MLIWHSAMKTDNECLIVNSAAEIPGHSMYGDWAIPGREYSYISLIDLAHKHGAGRDPVPIHHAEICAKPGNWSGHDDFSGKRFDAADPRYPGLLVENMPNPCNLRYRMVDGRRRLEKLRRMGITQSLFVIFDYAEALPFIFDFKLTR